MIKPNNQFIRIHLAVKLLCYIQGKSHVPFNQPLAVFHIPVLEYFSFFFSCDLWWKVSFEANHLHYHLRITVSNQHSCVATWCPTSNVINGFFKFQPWYIVPGIDMEVIFNVVVAFRKYLLTNFPICVTIFPAKRLNHNLCNLLFQNPLLSVINVHGVLQFSYPTGYIINHFKLNPHHLFWCHRFLITSRSSD